MSEVNGAKDLAESAMERGTFSFIDMIQDRTYPEVTVPLYLDEAKALRLVELDEEERALDEKVLYNVNGASEDQMAALDSIATERAGLKEELEKTAYRATIRGFDPDCWEDMSNEALEKFPEEFQEFGLNPLTGQPLRTPKKSPERAKYLAALVWRKAVVKLERHDGAVLEDQSVDEWIAFSRILPRSTRDFLDNTIHKVALSADWYKGLTDEVF